MITHIDRFPATCLDEPRGFRPETVPIDADLSRNDVRVLCRICDSYRVIEFGSGGSTLLFSRLAHSWISLESDFNWVELVTEALRERGHQRRCPVTLAHYVGTAPSMDDVIEAAGPGDAGHIANVAFIDGGDRQKILGMCLRSRLAETIVVHDSRRPRTHAEIMRALSDPELQPWLNSVRFHEDASNLTVIRLRSQPVRYENWNEVETEGRLPHLHKRR